MPDTEVPQFDPSDFDIRPYAKYVDKPWGHEYHLVPESTPYMMKIIHINAGAQISLQIHDDKRESWVLTRGKALILWEDEHGALVETEMEPDKGYSTRTGQKHRLKGITDADIVECSTPEAGTTWRLEDDYARPHETPEQRKIERGEA